MKYLYISFPTTAEAMMLEEVCQKKNIDGKLVPIPRELSAGCGIAWRCATDMKDNIEIIMQEENVIWEYMQIL